MPKTSPNLTRPVERCVHCGSRNKITRDHIPPKCLFSKPYPPNLITVPSCRKCNNSASLDDEYFRLTIVSRWDVGKSPEAQKVADKALRALSRPKAAGLRTLILGNVREFFFKNAKGLLEPSASYDVKLNRLDAVASRIVTGLFWEESGERLPNAYMASAFNDSGMSQMDDSQTGIIRSVFESKSRTVGEGVFRYWWQAAPEDKNTSVWILQFYDRVHFLCFTNPKSWEDERSLKSNTRIISRGQFAAD